MCPGCVWFLEIVFGSCNFTTRYGLITIVFSFIAELIAEVFTFYGKFKLHQLSDFCLCSLMILFINNDEWFNNHKPNCSQKQTCPLHYALVYEISIIYRLGSIQSKRLICTISDTLRTCMFILLSIIIYSKILIFQTNSMYVCQFV